MKINEYRLRNIIRNSIRKVVNEECKSFDFTDLKDNGSREEQMDYDFFDNDNTRFTDEFFDEDNGNSIHISRPKILDYEKSKIMKNHVGPFYRNDKGKRSMDTLDYLKGNGELNPGNPYGDNGDYVHDLAQRMALINDKHGIADKRAKRAARRNTKKMMDAADKRPLHRKGSLNRELD